MNARSLHLLAAAMLATATASPGGEAETGELFSPSVHQADRYQHIWKKSPFVTETPVVQQSGGLAERFALTGIAMLQNQPVIFVLDRQSLSRSVITKEPNPSGLALVSVQTNTDPKQSQATIRLGSEQALIHYDLAALQNVNQNPEAAAAKTTAANPAAETLQAQAGTNAAPSRVRVIQRPRPIKLSN